jgi:hypothetical protein
MADPLLDVVERLYAEVASSLTLAQVLAVVGRCRTELDAPSPDAQPELVERLARQRLTDLIAASATHSREAAGGALASRVVTTVGVVDRRSVQCIRFTSTGYHTNDSYIDERGASR